MAYVSDSLRTRVIDRADNRCEYCRLSQVGQVATFHIDHVMPLSAGGETKINNLALACVSCSLRKAARQTAQDPTTGETAPIFNPRRQSWSDHFRWEGVSVVGSTAIGRATIAVLTMNRPIMLAIRAEEAFFDRHPPP